MGQKISAYLLIWTRDCEVCGLLYLGVVFSGPAFSLRGTTEVRLTRGYASLGGLERMCAQMHFQEPRTKLWIFDTLVTSIILYGVQIWRASLDHHNRSRRTYDGWRSIEPPVVYMIFRMIRAKVSVPHEIIRAEMAAPPIMVEALSRSISFLHSIWVLPQDRYAQLVVESSRQLTVG